MSGAAEWMIRTGKDRACGRTRGRFQTGVRSGRKAQCGHCVCARRARARRRAAASRTHRTEKTIPRPSAIKVAALWAAAVRLKREVTKVISPDVPSVALASRRVRTVVRALLLRMSSGWEASQACKARKRPVGSAVRSGPASVRMV